MKYLQQDIVKAQEKESPESLQFKEVEIEELRTANTKVFQIEQNRFRYESYLKDIHFKEGDKYKEIDNSIIFEEGSELPYKNKANQFTFRVGKRLLDGVEYSDDSTNCRFGLSEVKGINLNNPEAETDQNKVKFKNIYSGADLEYSVLPEGVRTEIVIKNAVDLKEEFSFDLIGCDESTFDPPTMQDKNDIDIVAFKLDKNIENKLRVNTNLSDNKFKYKLNLKPDYKLLGQLDGEIRIDPSITKVATMDTFVTPSTLNTNNGMRRAIPLGTYTDYTICLVNACPPVFSKSKGLFKFPKLDIPNTAIIQSSKLELWHYGTNPNHGELIVSKVNEDWDERAIWPGPNASGGYARTKFPSYNSDIIAQKREIILNQDLIKLLSLDNFGLQVKNVNENEPGVVVCSRNIPSSPCNAGMEPKLIFEYIQNSPPNTPNLLLPVNGQSISGNCDESAYPIRGNCRQGVGINFELNNIGDSDPSPGGLDRTIIDFFDNEGRFLKSSAPIYGSGKVNFVEQLDDGIYKWKAKSIDKQGIWSSYSEELTFNVDSSPPSIPVIDKLNPFSPGIGIDRNLQIKVSANPSQDNTSIQTEISYKLQYSNDSEFKVHFEKEWQQNNSYFEIGPFGADNIKGTSDDLKSEKYYFRIKSKDKLNNISNWSNIATTTFDNTPPKIESFTSSENRFSPNNSTSLGIKDSVEFKSKYYEENIEKAVITVYSDLEKKNKVFEHIKDLTLDAPGEFFFLWTGKSLSNTDLVDGVYVVSLSYFDKAGNISISNYLLIIVDNSEANITISSPLNGYWTNKDNIDIKGQVTAPNEDGKEDGDIDKLNISNLKDSNIENILFDKLGLFQKLVKIEPGLNKFNLESIDTVGNKETIPLEVNYDNLAPNIFEISPNDTVNNPIPNIKFKVKDPDENASGLAIGKSPSNINIWLTYSRYDPHKSLYLPIKKDLISNGVNLDKTLIENLECSPESPIIIRNNLNSSNEIACDLKFKSRLPFDTDYKIHLEVFDIAGNKVEQESEFRLDTHVYLDTISPKSEGVYATSSLKVSGKASKEAILEIKHIELNKKATFILSESNNLIHNFGELLDPKLKITCGEFIDIDKTLETPNEEVCYWEIMISQKYSESNIYISNNLNISSTDIIGNVVLKKIKFQINLYALNLEISTDLDYFSPNGDGNQDSIIFTHTLTDKLNESLAGEIESYELEIHDQKSNLIRKFTGNNNLNIHTFWEGKYNPTCLDANNCSLENFKWVDDGRYSYILKVKTKEGVLLSTSVKYLYAKSYLEDEVIITSPKNNHITTRGVITVTGQAPTRRNTEYIGGKFRGDLSVEICVKTLAVNISCNINNKFPIDQNGYFSGIIVLPRTNNEQSIHFLTAVAKDDFGNHSKTSNIVKVIQDNLEPFKNISITPALTGISSRENYEKFLNGELGLDKIRTVDLNSLVTQNTNNVEYSFAKHTNLSKVEKLKFNHIAIINNETETNTNLNPYSNSSIKKNHSLDFLKEESSEDNCNEKECLWTYPLPIAYDLGGIYEVEFKGKKGETIQTLSAGFKVDGSLPAAPYIMVVEKSVESDFSKWVSIENINGTYYSNKKNLRIRGASEPNIKLKVILNDREIDVFNASQLGIWEKEIDLDKYLSDKCKESQNGTCVDADFSLKLVSIKEIDNQIIYEVPSSNTIKLKYDLINPFLKSVERVTPKETVQGWVKTGMKVDYFIEANEGLKYADLIKEDGYVSILSHLNKNKWYGNILVDRKEQGFYKPKIRFKDYAGNISIFDSSNELYHLPDSILKDWRIYIDNTVPDSTSLDISKWQDLDGIKADGVFPELSRHNLNYVTRSNKVVISGKAEKDQRVEILINNNLEKTESIGNNCETLNTNRNYSSDNLLVKDNIICNFSYEYKLPGKGKSHLLFVPLEYYIIQLRVVDKAGNISKISPHTILYHDTKQPNKPRIGTDVPEVTNNLSLSLNIQAERLSDIEISIFTPDKKLHERRISKASTVGNLKEKFKLGTKRDDTDSCHKIHKHRKIGTCEDGVYEFKVRSIDGPGNFSEESTIKVERDTVAPDIPSAEISTNRDLYTLKMRIKGESDSKAYVRLKGNENLYKLSARGTYTIPNLVGIYYPDTKYEAYVYVKDEAGNRSDDFYLYKETSKTGFCFQKSRPALNLPLRGKFISSKNGGFYDKRGSNFHVAQDFTYQTPKESFDKPIYSSEDGVVIFNQNGNYIYDKPNPLLATHISIRHDNKGLISEYAHLNQNFIKDRFVKNGEIIGTLGNTGDVYPVPRFSGDTRGSHLHYAVKLINPNSYTSYSREKQWESIYIDPMQVLNTECRGKEGTARGETEKNKYGDALNDDSAIKLFKDFIDLKLEDNTVITDRENKTVHMGGLELELPNKSTQKISQVENLLDTLKQTSYQWCGIWVQELNIVIEKNGDKSIKGALIINPYNQKVYLLKDEIWDKYYDNDGPCGEIGIPKDSSADTNYSENHVLLSHVYKVNGKEFIVSGKYQNFETSQYKENKIFKYNTLESNCLIGFIGCKNTEKNYTYFVVGKVSSWYEEHSGVNGVYGLPIEDTQDCKQSFSFQNTIDLCNGRIGIPIKVSSEKSDKLRDEKKNGVDYENIYVNLTPVQSQNNKEFEGERSIPEDYLDKYVQDKEVWIVTHGFTGAFEGNIKEIAKNIKKTYPDAIVLGLDWSDPAYGNGLGTNLSVDNCRVATWIKPISIEVYKRLKEWGLNEPTRLNLVGHSLGTLLNIEISKNFGNIKSFIALDPPSELNCKYYGPYETNKYLTQLNPKAVRGDFNNISEFSRSFLGKWSIGGNEELSKSALESFYMNFDGIMDNKNPSQHTWVVNSYNEIIGNKPFEEINNVSIFSLKDLSVHKDWQKEYEGKCHVGKGVFQACKRTVFNGHNGLLEIHNRKFPEFLEVFINGNKRKYEKKNK